MTLDAVVANPGRLRILTALAAQPRQEFVALRRRTSLTDGNLACHARRLAGAGLISIDKQIRAGKPVTQLELTLAGRDALEQHARAILSAVNGASEPTTTAEQPVPDLSPEPDDDWID